LQNNSNSWRTSFRLRRTQFWNGLSLKILLFQHCTNCFKILSTFRSRMKQTKLLSSYCVSEIKKQTNGDDTGRCWGCFFQHICINLTSFWGQFEGILGVNPLSLYSKMKNQNEKFVKWKVKERELKQTNKQTHRMRSTTCFGSMSLWGSRWALISQTTIRVFYSYWCVVTPAEGGHYTRVKNKYLPNRIKGSGLEGHLD
jgi:hypothetical protein